MSIHDFRRLSGDEQFQADVCIIGSGPASWTLVDALRDSGLSVLVLESGGALESGLGLEDAEAEALNAVVDVGQPLFNGRRRTLGGTTEVAGWANRTIAFDPIDYEARAWVPHSGWPFDEQTIAPFLDRAARQLGLGETAVRAPAIPGSMHRPPVNPDDLTPVTWVFGEGDDRKPTRYARLFRERQRKDLRVLVHATVTQIVTNAAGTHVEGVEISSSDGRCAKVSARVVVLAAGGIENPRILLNSNRLMPLGLGNQHGLVGRFLMDHPRDLGMAVTFDPREADQLRAIFGPYRVRNGREQRYAANGFALSAARQRRDGLLNCVAWLIEEWAENDPVEAAKRLAKRQGDRVADVRAVMANSGLLLLAAHARLAGGQALHHKCGNIGLVIGSEQQPDPESRVTLADAVDRFGLPLARTQWRINQIDRTSQATLALMIEREFLRLGLPQPRLADWAREGGRADAPLVDGCHPTGTTRMADDPHNGVVDSNCQVHGVAGLYVAGSSVFPTAGHANPTLMIAAMAARLADHLAARIARDDVKTVRPQEPERQLVMSEHATTNETLRSLPVGARVVVTGASGFLGGRLVERLVGDGADVLCLLRGQTSARLQQLGVETRIVDLADAEALSAATAEVDYVFHCAYDWSDDAWNSGALTALLAAGRAHGWQRLIHVSSFVVYDMPPSGELTEEVIETTTPWGYARVKVDLEAAVMASTRSGGVPATIIQPTLVYGPRSQPWTIDPIEKLSNGTVILPDRGDGVCNAVFVDDVVDAMLLAARVPGAVGRRFLISGDAVRWRDFYETLAHSAGVRGPVYMPRETILRKNQRTAKLLRGLLTPRLLARKIAGADPARRVIERALPMLPRRLRAEIQDQLYGPITRLRGHMHLPDAAALNFMESSARIDSGEARRVIGYVPQVDLATGMAATAVYLQNEHRHRD